MSAEQKRFWNENKLDKAEDRFLQAVEDDHKSSLAHAQLAGFYLMQNRTQQAVAAYQEAIMPEPEKPELFPGIAQLMIERELELDPQLDNAKELKDISQPKWSI
jgi:cytochrome c-type biogenesis protein CcmH/NrfG